MIMQRPLVYVEWHDHHGAQEWQNSEDVKHSPFLCKSVGWLFHDSASGITIYSSEYDNVVGNTQYIIKSCITKYQVLRKGGFRKARAVKKDVLLKDDGGISPVGTEGKRGDARKRI